MYIIVKFKIYILDYRDNNFICIVMSSVSMLF